jgi:predicted transposase YbfD/YdcC
VKKLEVLMKPLVEHFVSLPDPRHTRNRRHLLHEVVIIALAAVLIGCEGPTAIHRWASFQRDWLKTWLRLPGGIPSKDCIRRVLATLKPEAFQACFTHWIAACLARQPADVQRYIRIDGKTLRRSHDRKAALGALHLVSAWASDCGLVLGQVATEEKSNEITAIPELLRQIDVCNALVTIDAMGCQREIVRQIVEQKGDCILAVKDNQPKLYAAIEQVFSQHLENDLADIDHRYHEQREQGHGRTDDRFYYLARLPQDFPLRAQWPQVKAIGMAVRVTEQSNGKHSDEVRYYIATRYVSGARFAEAVRGHWSIENTLHWQLDVNYREDDSRTRQRHLASNLAWLRRFGISLLKQHPHQDSLRGKRQIANWNNQFLLEVLTGKAT